MVETITTIKVHSLWTVVVELTSLEIKFDWTMLIDRPAPLLQIPQL